MCSSRKRKREARRRRRRRNRSGRGRRLRHAGRRRRIDRQNAGDDPAAFRCRAWRRSACCWSAPGKREKFGTAELRRLAAAAVRYSEVSLGEEHRVSGARRRTRRGGRRKPSPRDCCSAISTATNTAPTRRTRRSNRRRSVGFDAAAQAGVDRGRIIGESQNFTRELGNEPSNLLTPRCWPNAPQPWRAKPDLAIDILDEKRIEELKMGALLSVARGSAEPPRLMVLTYTPEKQIPGRAGAGPGRQSRHLRHRRHLHQARQRYGKDEVRYGRRRGHARRDARARAA